MDMIQVTLGQRVQKVMQVFPDSQEYKENQVSKVLKVTGEIYYILYIICLIHLNIYYTYYFGDIIIRSLPFLSFLTNFIFIYALSTLKQIQQFFTLYVNDIHWNFTTWQLYRKSHPIMVRNNNNYKNRYLTLKYFQCGCLQLISNMKYISISAIM